MKPGIFTAWADWLQSLSVVAMCYAVFMCCATVAWAVWMFYWTMRIGAQ